MTQATSDIRSIRSPPSIYSRFQHLVGAEHARRYVCIEYIRVQPEDIIVDLGCGPADILSHLEDRATNFGFDLSQTYIDSALLRFPHSGIFSCRDLTSLPRNEIPPCQFAIAVGVLHHLYDEQATARIKISTHGLRQVVA